MKRMVTNQDVVKTVNQAIEEGEISGGTKLYRHVLSDKNGATGYVFIVNSTNSELYTKNGSGSEAVANAIKNDLKNIVSMFFDGLSSSGSLPGYYPLYIIDNYLTAFIVDEKTYSVVATNYDDFGSLEDGEIVTPL